MEARKQTPDVVVGSPGVIRVHRSYQLQFTPRSLAGRIFAVALAICIVILGFFFLAIAIALAGILIAIGIGRLLWASSRRDPR